MRTHNSTRQKHWRYLQQRFFDRGVNERQGKKVERWDEYVAS